VEKRGAKKKTEKRAWPAAECDRERVIGTGVRVCIKRKRLLSCLRSVGTVYLRLFVW